MTQEQLDKRITTSVRMANLPENILQAIKRRERIHRLDNILRNPICAIKTDSTKIRLSYFNKIWGKQNKTHTVYSFITKEWLVLIVEEGKLIDVALFKMGTFDVQKCSSRIISSFVFADNGLRIMGFRFCEDEHRSDYFLGLGEEHDAKIFAQKLLELTNHAN